MATDDESVPDETMRGGTPEFRGDGPVFRLEDFEILGELGRGGMGVVYKARQRSLRRTVALKTIAPGRLQRPVDVERFRLEAEAAGRLSHPNIVPVFEIGSSGDTHYFSMGFVEGESLADRLSRGPLPEHEAAAIVREVARAIHYAHEQGVIHRDLKPANILIDRDGGPRITDFGLAKTLDRESGPTVSGDMLGTPNYMPPEQALGKGAVVGPASDVWALGAILYALLAGRPPFAGTTLMDTLRQVVENDPAPLRIVAPGVSRDLELIVRKCLQKPAELRYETAGALAEDLDAFLEGGEISAASAHLSDLFARWLGETPQSYVLQFWGSLWLVQGFFLLGMMIVAQVLLWARVTSHLPYILALVLSFALWAPIFVGLRRRRGPITLAERQLAHAWGGNLMAIGCVLSAEWMLGLPVLTLAPLMLVLGATACVVIASILSGVFYVHAAAHLFGVALMLLFPDVKMLIAGVFSSAAFLVPGLRIVRRNRGMKSSPAPAESFYWAADSDEAHGHDPGGPTQP